MAASAAAVAGTAVVDPSGLTAATVMSIAHGLSGMPGRQTQTIPAASGTPLVPATLSRGDPDDPLPQPATTIAANPNAIHRRAAPARRHSRPRSIANAP